MMSVIELRSQRLRIRVLPSRGGILASFQFEPYETAELIDVFQNGGEWPTMERPALFCPGPMGTGTRNGKLLWLGEELELGYPLFPKDARHFAFPWVGWHLTERTGSAVTLEMLRSRDASGYIWPSNYRARLWYSLSEESLDVELEIENLENRPMPVAPCTHPVIAREIRGDAKPCLEAVGEDWYPSDSEGFPTGKKRAVTDGCFRGTLSASGRGIRGSLGAWEGKARIRWPAAGLELIAEDIEGNSPFLGVANDPESEVVSIELQATLGDALELRERGIDIPLPILKKKGDVFRIHHRYTPKEF